MSQVKIFLVPTATQNTNTRITACPKLSMPTSLSLSLSLLLQPQKKENPKKRKPISLSFSRSFQRQMAVQWVLVCHGLITLLVLVSFLCGQWPIFQGTFIERIHVFLTFGAYDYFLYSLSLSQSILFHCYSSLIHLFDHCLFWL